ncbi:tetratricopeptide repeat protein [Treponema endosymbiont of Eucomonympha sp.]|uniref:tetratricopeptide repeat protein n=1 Tax=Treponema endosymbiont of Eucomonympha sp. TaxID=1580831 RepID=UPI00078133A8|nr:tetratricopeptide repeat protein [Treponema endosymbiont of Eucomonympha sp.]
MAENSGKINAEAAAFLKQGKKHFDKKEYGAAIEAYTKAIGLQPDYAEAFSNRGCVYTDKGDYDKAIADYDEAIRLKPDITEAYYGRPLFVSQINFVNGLYNFPSIYW